MNSMTRVRRHSAISIVGFVAGFFLLATLANSQGQHRPIFPLAPDQLLKLLPSAPAQWSTVTSNASSNFSGWLTSQATRRFTSAASSTPNVPAAATRFVLTDTGYYPEALGQFEGFRPGKDKENESTVINGLPAIKTTKANIEILTVLIRGRFVLQIRTDNQKPNSCEAWLRMVNVQRIASVPDSAETSIPQPVTITRVDELDPKNNGSYQLTWTSAEQQKQDALREHAAQSR